MRGKWLGLAAGLGLAIGGMAPFALLAVRHRAASLRPAVQPPPKWPYCAPEATPPPGTVNLLDDIPPELAGVDALPGLEPLATAVVTVSAVVTTGDPAPSGSDSAGFQQADVTIASVLWKTGHPIDPGQQSVVALVPGTVSMSAHQQMWQEITSALANGSTPLIGVGELQPDARYNTRFAFDPNPSAPAFLGSEPFASHYTRVFRAFLASTWNPMQGAPLLSVVVAWNVEADSPTADTAPGPITVGWNAFIQREVIQGGYPQAGTAEWWNAAPALCRMVKDAPSSDLTGLIQGEVWVYVPHSWRSVTDGVPCLRIDLGQLGCSRWDVIPGFDYIFFDQVYAQPGLPIYLDIAHLINGTPSWVDRVNVATIPWAQFIPTRLALVELNGGAAPSSYQELKGGSGVGLASTQLMTPDQRAQLIEEAPKATPDPDCPGPSCTN